MYSVFAMVLRGNDAIWYNIVVAHSVFSHEERG